MCAIVLGDGEVKADYKLPHHRASGYATVRRAVAAAAAVLMGGRGGVNAPESDILGAKGHIGKHYADCELGTPPWEKGFTLADLRHYEPEDAKYLLEAVFVKGILSRASREEVEEALATLRDLWSRSEPEPGARPGGRVLSAKNRGLVKAAIEALEALLAAAEPIDAEEARSLTAQAARERLAALRSKYGGKR
jgi:hypothetical protein